MLCISARVAGLKYCRTLRGLPLVSSADGERGAPPMVAGCTLALHNLRFWDLCLTTEVV